MGRYKNCCQKFSKRALTFSGGLKASSDCPPKEDFSGGEVVEVGPTAGPEGAGPDGAGPDEGPYEGSSALCWPRRRSVSWSVSPSSAGGDRGSEPSPPHHCFLRVPFTSHFRFHTLHAHLQTRTNRHIFLNFMFLSFSPRIFSMLFFAYQVSSTIDACHIFKSSYDETINKLLVSSYELLNI